MKIASKREMPPLIGYKNSRGGMDFFRITHCNVYSWNPLKLLELQNELFQSGWSEGRKCGREHPEQDLRSLSPVQN